MIFSYILPDVLVILLALCVLILDLLRLRSSTIWVIAVSGVAGILLLLNMIPAGWDRHWLGGNWSLSNFGLLMREFFLASALATIVLARPVFLRGEEGFGAFSYKPEFIAAVLFVTFGAITVISAQDLLTLFVGLELATIPLYVLVAWNKRNPLAAEAATKYVLMGSVSTAIMLFGMSYLFGFSGSLRFAEIAQAVATQSEHPLLWISVLFLISGVGFKLTLFPFHTWAPDVYDGASTPVTAFLSVTSKATAISFLVVLLMGPLAAIHQTLQPLLILLASATMTIGNLGALKQTRLRRFMAWSSVAQAGYILTALTGPGSLGKPAIVFYLFTYAFANYLLFFLYSAAAGPQREQNFASLVGIARQRPWLGAALAIGLFSLAGIPPLAGFLGKFFLFAPAAHAGHFAFLVFVGLNTVVGLYCYLQVLKAGWVEDAAAEQSATMAALPLSRIEVVTIVTLSILVLAMGIAPWLANTIHAILLFGP